MPLKSWGPLFLIHSKVSAFPASALEWQQVIILVHPWRIPQLKRCVQRSASKQVMEVSFFTLCLLLWPSTTWSPDASAAHGIAVTLCGTLPKLWRQSGYWKLLCWYFTFDCWGGNSKCTKVVFQKFTSKIPQTQCLTFPFLEFHFLGLISNTNIFNVVVLSSLAGDAWTEGKHIKFVVWGRSLHEPPSVWLLGQTPKQWLGLFSLSWHT